MVFYDGERLCVQLSRNKNYKIVLKIAEQSEYSEYIPNANIYCLPPTKKNATLLFEAGYSFDNSAKIFLKEKNKKVKKEQYNLPDELYPFQKEGVLRLLSTDRHMLLGDDMGLGKTVQVANYLAFNEQSFPALIICPASLKKNWEVEIKKWTGKDSYIISGRNEQYFSEEFIEKYPVFIINYDILGTENKEEREQEQKRIAKAKKEGKCFKKKILPVYGWVDELIRHGFQTIVCDEVQYISGSETMRARGVKQICNSLKKARRIFVSGTPYETKTSQFFTALNLLDKKHFPNEWKFKMRYCNPVKTYFGWKFEGASNIDELRELLEPIMIRRLKKDVLTELPPKIRSVISLTVSDSDRYEYDRIDIEFQNDILSGKKNKSQQLGHLAHLKQGAYKAKEKAIFQWISEYLEYNDKLVVFTWHNEAFNNIIERFKKIGVVGINGGTPTEQRNDIVNKFQNDKKIRLFVGQIQACGAGLTLTASNATAFVEFGRSWVQHEQAEDRVHRISQKADSVLAYYLILDNSIENDCMSALEIRNRDQKAVMDGEENAKIFEDMNQTILNNYLKKINKK